MAPCTKEDVFETIENQLKENQIVTFKWLSRTLKLHSTISKQYLKDFVQNEPEDKFVITYMVFGRKENGELLLMLTKEKDDAQFSKKNITVVDKQVYSIQPLQSNFDTTMIYNIDKSTYELQQMSLSSINYHTEIIRKTNTSRIAIPSESTTNHVSQTNSVRQSITNGHAVVKKNDTSKNDSSEEPSGNKNSSAGKAVCGKKEKIKQPAPNGRIASFFTKGNVKKEPVTKEETVEVAGEESEMPESDVAPEKTVSKNKSPDVIKETKEETVEVEKEKQTESSPKDKKVKQPPKKTAESKKAGKAASSKKTKAKENKKNKKQRKRIVSSLDSSEDESEKSDSCNEEPELELEPEPQPEPQPVEVPETPRVTVVNGKKRKRKEIIKEVLDDKGYLNTVKEIIYESCDSDEEEEEEKPNEPNKTSKVKEPQPVNPRKRTKVESTDTKNQKTKQASILNFFKKPQKS